MHVIGTDNICWSLSLHFTHDNVNVGKGECKLPVTIDLLSIYLEMFRLFSDER